MGSDMFETWEWEGWPYVPPHEEKVKEKEVSHTHVFPDTGLRKSWCTCGQEGVFVKETGKYQAKENV